MDALRTLGKWVTTSDAALSWGERVAKWIVEGGIAGAVSTLAGPVIGYLAGNTLYGLVIGAVLGMLILVGFCLKAINVAVSGLPQTRHPESVDPVAQESPPQEPPPYDPDASYFKEESIYLADFARGGVRIKGKTFEDCQIFGPAIIAPFYGSWPFFNCTWAEEPDWDSIIWEIPSDREKHVGLIGIEANCTFRRCHFVRVGILTNPERARRVKEGAENR